MMRRAIPASLRRPGTLLAVVALATFGCGSEQAQEAGQYRILTVSDGMFGRCQPRTELYFVNAAGAAPEYLGTCSTPKFVTDHLGLPSDPSCFAVAADGTALVYFHRPNWCGAGEAAANKPGGVYRHGATEGDTLLYSDLEHVSQVWGRDPVPADAIRVAWKNARPSRGGAVCAQRLIIKADGSESPIGTADTVHGCVAGRDGVAATGD